MTETRSVSEGPDSHVASTPAFGVQFVCPLCHTNVARRGAAWICESADCRRRYPIVDDIPKFIIEEAVQLDPAEWESLLAARDH
jgi:uncharacterized protein YbaR (Trm112 family)